MCIFAQSNAANRGTLRIVGMIEGERLGFAGVISLAHGLLFFIRQRLLVSYSSRAGQYLFPIRKSLAAEPQGQTLRRAGLCRDLTARGPVEDNPHGEVLGKVLKTMLGSRSHEQKVACLKRVLRAVVNQDASAADDDVDLVLLMRSLPVRRHGEGEFYIKCAALQKAD